MNVRIFLWLSALVAAQLAGAEERVDFNRDIRPLLSNACAACHGPDEQQREADLRLDTREGATEDRGGYAAVVPGDPDASELIQRVTASDPYERMPPEGKGRPLTEAEIDRLRTWIRQGADYDVHWAYVKPERPPLPEVRQKDWPRNGIDHFILARVEAAGLEPSPEADRFVLARRVAIDLTGLPPTWEEAQAFVNDGAEDAYERYVDRLLKKPAFGERWARVWLDLARYADSAGYADDPSRTIWAFRDYVIRSLNANKPFDQFTIEQIAGDLLENPTEDQLVATAFHRNTMTNNEGGTNDEQFRNEAVVDRVNTTMAVWMGTTIACAQCHTHKYDPITQAEYFQFFDFFNQSQDADRRDESPLAELWSDQQKEQKSQWQAEIAALRAELDTQTPELDAALNAWLARMRTQPVWEPLVPRRAESAEAELQIADGGTISLQGERPGTATWTVRVPVPEPTEIAGLRLEIPEAQKNNFVLSQLTAHWEPAAPAGTEARFVRIELPGDQRMLHLAEVQVFSGAQNIAPRGTASQSSTDYGGQPQRAIDGNTDGDYSNSSVSHTAAEQSPWLEIDLGTAQAVDHLVLWNRTDGGRQIAERLQGVHLKLLDENRQVVWQHQPNDLPSPDARYATSGARELRFTAAIADHVQPGFSAEAVLAAAADAKKGWAIGGETGKPHRLSLFFEQPQEIDAGELIFRIAQTSEHAHHVLTHLRLAATADPTAAEWARVPDSLRETLRRDSLTAEQRASLAEFFRSTTPMLQPQREQLAELEKQLAEMKPVTTVPVMRELAADKRRTTHVQIRGNYQNTGAEVSAGVPAVFHPLPEDLPRNRLALARWLVDEDNPLTPRVVANRHWEQIFGTGIVETSEEFGSQGELPSHPQLLDWLAVEFRESGWDIKALLKLLVTSATYRQSSVITSEALAVDPANRLLARGPRFRISAEMVRDQALAVSGLLSDKMYGPPVQPPQPELGLRAAFGSATDWTTSAGEDRYRRGLYTTWRRSNPYPSMATFDAPNREVCTVRRTRTNTPLQALVTLNDPVYVEAAQALGRRMAASGETIDQRIAAGLRTCLVREPRAAELERLVQLYRDLYKQFAQAPDEARKMAEDPLGPLPEGADVTEAAALAVVGNVILNLDEMLMPR